MTIAIHQVRTYISLI